MTHNIGGIYAREEENVKFVLKSGVSGKFRLRDVYISIGGIEKPRGQKRRRGKNRQRNRTAKSRTGITSSRRKFGTIGRNCYICRVNCVHSHFFATSPRVRLVQSGHAAVLPATNKAESTSAKFLFSSPFSPSRGWVSVFKSRAPHPSTIRLQHVRNHHSRPSIARFCGLRLWLRQAATQPLGLPERRAGQQRNLRPCRSAV